ncbi:MAG: alpha/beta hydrolase, partial [Myxococcota bacterium]
VGVAVVVEALDALGWERCAVVGHSMGAGVGLLTAGAFPERISLLVMVDGVGPLTCNAAGAPQRLRSALTSEASRRGLPSEPRVYPSLESMAERRRLATGLRADVALRLVERAAEATEGGWRYRHDRRLRGSSRLRLTESHVESFASAVQAPVQIIVALDSPAVPEGLIKTRLAGTGTVQIHRVKGGHHVHLEHPERVAPLVHASLRALDSEQGIV